MKNWYEELRRTDFAPFSGFDGNEGNNHLLKRIAECGRALKKVIWCASILEYWGGIMVKNVLHQ